MNFVEDSKFQRKEYDWPDLGTLTICQWREDGEPWEDSLKGEVVLQKETRVLMSQNTINVLYSGSDHVCCCLHVKALFRKQTGINEEIWTAGWYGWKLSVLETTLEDGGREMSKKPDLITGEKIWKCKTYKIIKR